MTWTMTHLGACGFHLITIIFCYFFYFWTQERKHQSIKKIHSYNINSLFSIIKCAKILRYTNTLNLGPLLFLKWWESNTFNSQMIQTKFVSKTRNLTCKDQSIISHYSHSIILMHVNYQLTECTLRCNLCPHTNEVPHL